MIRISLLFCLSVCFWQAYSQYTTYIPLSRSSKKDSLIRFLDSQKKLELRRMRANGWKGSHLYLDAISDTLKGLVAKGKIIQDQTLKELVSGVTTRICNSNNITTHSDYALIVDDVSLNAFSCGNGIFLLNIGLLAEMSNESQIAFIVSHEIAHYELSHFLARVGESNIEKVRKKARALARGKGSAKAANSFRDVLYEVTSNSRRDEVQADSLGLVLMRNAGYSQNEAIIALQHLDVENPSEETDLDFILTLDQEEYPMKETWFAKRPVVYEGKFHGIFLTEDSLRLHPVILTRKSNLESIMSDHKGKVNYQPNSLTEASLTLAKFEAVESAYKSKAYDLCLYKALKLMQVHKNNSYLTAMIARVLIDLYEIKDYAYDIHYFIRKSTFGYPEGLRMVNDFLHNIHRNEIGNLAYSFLTTNSRFDNLNEELYFQLWRISSLTNRSEETKAIEGRYREEFPEGKYLAKMKNYKPYKGRQVKGRPKFTRWYN